MDRRQFVLGAALLGITAASLALKPRRMFARLGGPAIEAAIPKQLGPYSFASVNGLVLPPQDELSAKLYDYVLTRMYQRAGFNPVGLCIAYGSAQDSGLQLHRPDECYPAQGFTIGDRRALDIDLAGHRVPAITLVASRPDRTEHLLYWTRIGSLFPTDARAERMKIYLDNLKGQLPDGVLVRLSESGGDATAAQAELLEFAKLLYAGLDATSRQVLLGGAPKAA